MGIDIYLEWDGMTDDDKDQQYSACFSPDRGEVGYLRESYHGEPYATQLLVREAFEAEDCRAEIPAAIMRERLTHVTEPVYGKTGGHDIARVFGNMLKMAAANDPNLKYEGGCEGSGQTRPMTVEEAVILRAKKLYNASDDEAAQMVHVFESFVALAERKEKELGKPCTVYASY